MKHFPIIAHQFKTEEYNAIYMVIFNRRECQEIKVYHLKFLFLQRLKVDAQKLIKEDKLN